MALLPGSYLRPQIEDLSRPSVGGDTRGNRGPRQLTFLSSRSEYRPDERLERARLRVTGTNHRNRRPPIMGDALSSDKLI